ncbi:MAG: hypothetical protein H8E27_14050 [Verrucomicrobia subdivision 3 bacterium]|nr:hypothetical protein [Limisphaerales bacterium]
MKTKNKLIITASLLACLNTASADVGTNDPYIDYAPSTPPTDEGYPVEYAQSSPPGPNAGPLKDPYSSDIFDPTLAGEIFVGAGGIQDLLGNPVDDGIFDWSNFYSRGNDDPAEIRIFGGQFSSGHIAVTLRTDTSDCKIVLKKCEGNVALQFKYDAHTLNPRQHDAFLGLGSRFGIDVTEGPGNDLPTMTVLTPRDLKFPAMVALRGTIDLGKIPCSEGKIAGVSEIKFNPRRIPNGFNDDIEPQQIITYSASTQECGKVSADISARQVFVRPGGVAVPLRHIGSTYLFGPFQEPYPERR